MSLPFCLQGILESLNYGTQLLELSNEEKLKSLTFNEDLQARPWWSPSPDVDYLSGQASYVFLAGALFCIFFFKKVIYTFECYIPYIYAPHIVCIYV